MEKTDTGYLILVEDDDGLVLEEVRLDSEVLTAGRDPDCEIHLPGPEIPLRAAEIRLVDNRPILMDLGSLNGISVNGKSVERQELRHGDSIAIGDFRLRVLAPGIEDKTVLESGVVDAGATVLLGSSPVTLTMPSGEVRALDPGTYLIGRGDECDIAINLDSVSKEHASISVSLEQVTIVDLGSTNGTLVNGRRVQSEDLVDGDQLEIGGQQIDVNVRSAQAVPAHAAGTVLLGPDGEIPDGTLSGTIVQRQLDEEHGTNSGQGAGITHDPGSAAAARRRNRRVLLLGALLLVTIGVFGIVILGSGGTEPEGVVLPAPTPVTDLRTPLELAAEADRAYARGEVFGALELWEQSLAIDPGQVAILQQFARVLYRVGYIYARAGDESGAREHWERLLEVLEPLHPQHEYVVRARVAMRAMASVQ